MIHGSSVSDRPQGKVGSSLAATRSRGSLVSWDDWPSKRALSRYQAIAGDSFVVASNLRPQDAAPSLAVAIATPVGRADELALVDPPSRPRERHRSRIGRPDHQEAELACGDRAWLDDRPHALPARSSRHNDFDVCFIRRDRKRVWERDGLRGRGAAATERPLVRVAAIACLRSPSPVSQVRQP